MTIRPVRQYIPTTLPPARLYLDDIIEICGIFNGSSVDSSTTFIVGNQTCDTFDDLEELGGRTTTFRMKTSTPKGSWGLDVAEHRTEIQIFERDDAEAGWSKYARVLAIFEKRKLKLKAVLNRSWISALIGASSALIVMGLFASLGSKAFRSVPIFIAAGLLTFLVNRYFLGWHSVVEFRYSHKVGAKRWFDQHQSEILMLIIGSIVGAVITGVVGKFLK
jgi:hypothetical protein